MSETKNTGKIKVTFSVFTYFREAEKFSKNGFISNSDGLPWRLK